MDRQIKALEQRIDRENFIRKFFAVLVGCFFVTISIVLVLKPNDMISGGVNGISILIAYVTNWPLSVLIFILNLPLLFIGFFLISREFIYFTIFSTISISIYIAIFSL